MAHEFTQTRRVEFAETDMAGIMHFSNYFRYLESAEHAFFRSVGLRVHSNESHGMKGWARVHASCDYLAPLRYEDEVEVHLVVSEMKTKSIAYEAVLRCSGRLVARAKWAVVCVECEAGAGGMTSAKIPDDVAAAIEAAPAEKIETIMQRNG